MLFPPFLNMFLVYHLCELLIQQSRPRNRAVIYCKYWLIDCL